MRTNLRKPYLVILAALLAGFATIETAAQQSAIDTLNRSRLGDEIQSGMSLAPGEAPPELFPGESTDVGPQSILKLKPRRRHWEASTDSQYLYTSNMLLTEAPTARTATSLLVNTVQFAMAPDAYELRGRSFSPRIGFRHQWFNYGLEDSGRNLDAFDFDAQTIFLDGRYSVAENWIANLGLNYTRLLGHQPGVADHNEFYKEWAPRWGLERYLPLGERQVIRLGYQGEYHVSEVDPVPPVLTAGRNDRLDQTFIASYTHAFNAHLIAQPFYRFQYTAYTASGADRNDFLNTVGLALAWVFNEYASVRLFTTYDYKESDNALVADYRKFDAGGGLSLRIRF